ncbi:MAG: cell division protein FtsH, partial [Casimicrobiaceae bacterium]
ALGVTMSLPEKDKYSYDREFLMNQIAMLFGGRVAEEVFMGQQTTGAANDFERATHMARDMVMRYGMSDALGPMVYAEDEGEVFLGRSITRTNNVSSHTLLKIEEEIRRIVDAQYALAKKLITENADKMHAMAKALLEYETIDSDQIDDILAGRAPRLPKQPPASAASPPPPPPASGSAEPSTNPA